jgi:hypothetical protein
MPAWVAGLLPHSHARRVYITTKVGSHLSTLRSIRSVRRDRHDRSEHPTVPLDELVRQPLALLEFVEPLAGHAESLGKRLLIDAEGEPFEAEDSSRGASRDRGMGQYLVESSRDSGAHIGENRGVVGTCQAPFWVLVSRHEILCRVARRASMAGAVTGRASRLAQLLWRDALLVVTGLAVAFLAWELALILPRVTATPGAVGVDLHTYQGAAASWLAGDGFYQRHQIAAPYQITGGWDPAGADILYPPVSLLLFVPFTVLPEILWYVVPLAAFGWAIWRLRPARWTWPLITAGIALPMSVDVVIRGNPAIWVAAAFAVGCVTAGPAVLVLLKPSLFPFAVMGANHRRWWMALALFALASLPFGFLWLDWLRVLMNSNGSLLYSLLDMPLFALALVAWMGRYRPPAISAANVTWARSHLRLVSRVRPVIANEEPVQTHATAPKANRDQPIGSESTVKMSPATAAISVTTG